MQESKAWDRFGAVSGIAFALLTIIGITIGIGQANQTGRSAVNDPSGVIAIGFVAQRDEMRFGAIALVVGVFFLLWFLPFLRSRLERSPEGGGWLPGVAHGGGMLAGAMLLMLGSLSLAGSILPDYKGDWQVAKLLLVIAWDHLLVLAPALAALVGATAIVGVRSGTLPAWLGWASFVLVIAPVFVAPALMTLLFLLWAMVVSSILLYQTFSLEPPPYVPPPQ